MNGEEIRHQKSRVTAHWCNNYIKKNFFFKLSGSCFGPQHMKQKQKVSSSLFKETRKKAQEKQDSKR